MALNYLVDAKTGRAHLTRAARTKLDELGIGLPARPSIEEVEEVLEIAALGSIDEPAPTDDPATLAERRTGPRIRRTHRQG